MHQAVLFKQLSDNQVACQLCSHFCVINEGDYGRCRTRININGKLFALNKDRYLSLAVDPVEKKPLFHFLPGSSTFSIGAPGCNFSCLFCQNYQLSHPFEYGMDLKKETPSNPDPTPEQLVQLAQNNRCQIMAYTYSEPTVFMELMAETAEIANEQGLKNIMVSNGFQSPAALKKLAPLIQGANIDLKAFSEQFYTDLCGASLKPVLRNLEIIATIGWILEITTLLIPGHNDSDAELKNIAGFIVKNLGSEIPWHVSAFYPTFKLQNIRPTSSEDLLKAIEIGKAQGLKNIYSGNRPGSGLEDTYCQECGEIIIKRTGYTIDENRLKQGCCPSCACSPYGIFS